jgi:predicted dehydrogenase
MPTPLPIDRPLRLAVVGAGQIAELVLPAYLARDDIEIVGLCDRNPDRLKRWGTEAPGALATTALDDVLATSPDVVDVLVPTPDHAAVASAVLDAGYHVQVQKPIARDLTGADTMLEAAERSGATLSVLEDYLCYPPLVRLGELVAAGEIGNPVGLALKIVATGRGGWEVDPSAYEWQFRQAQDGRGMLVFDHGWHQIALSMALFGPVRRIFAWLGETEIVPGIVMDAPSTLIWEHANGVRAVLEITFAIDTYFRSTHYTGDERVEVTGSRGYARCNRISACGIQEPSLVLYRDGETRCFHDLDDTPPDAFAAMAERTAEFFGGRRADPVMSGGDARAVLTTLLAGLESQRRGRPVDVREVDPRAG